MLNTCYCAHKPPKFASEYFDLRIIGAIAPGGEIKPSWPEFSGSKSKRSEHRSNCTNFCQA